MAGSGTSAPVLDFKPLWTELAREYRVVAVEEAGYEFSNVAKGIPQDIDSILAEYRQSLKLAGETSSPFVMVAHPMSALEAIYVTVPPLPVLRVLSFLASMGVTRLSRLSPTLQSFNPAI